MNFSELLLYQGSIYLNFLFETEDNTLIVDIDCCQNNEKVGKGDFSDYSSLDVDYELPTIRLEFDSYIAYSVRNESFTAVDEYEISEGKTFLLYSSSRYLDFIEVGTTADDIVPGPYKHYGINTLNHINDVAAAEPPKILMLQRDMNQE